MKSLKIRLVNAGLVLLFGMSMVSGLLALSSPTISAVEAGLTPAVMIADGGSGGGNGGT